MAVPAVLAVSALAVPAVLAVPAILARAVLAPFTVLFRMAAVGLLVGDSLLSRSILVGLRFLGGRRLGLLGLNGPGLDGGLFARLTLGLGLGVVVLGARRRCGGGPIAGGIGGGLAVAVGADASEIEDHFHDVGLAGLGVWAPAHSPCDDLKLRSVFALKFRPRELSGLYAHVSPLKCHNCGSTSLCSARRPRVRSASFEKPLTTGTLTIGMSKSTERSEGFP